MFLKSMSLYSIVNFDKKNYNKVIKNIIKSNGYLSFIDRKMESGQINKSYEEYLVEKQTYYTSASPHVKKEEGKFFTYTLPDGVSEKQIKDLEKKYKVENDYYVQSEVVTPNDSSMKAIIHNLTLFEQETFDIALNLDNQIELLNSSCLNESFIKNKQRRFTLLPFVAQHEDKNIGPIVIATVYDVGIITLQIIITVEYDQTPKVDIDPPRAFRINKVDFYNIKKKYNKDDFWSKFTLENVPLDDFLSYYESFLENISKVKMTLNTNHRPLSWSFGDYSLSRNVENHEKFIENNKSLYVSHLRNSNKEVTLRLTEKDKTFEMNEADISRNSELAYFCNPTSSLVSVGYKAIYDRAKEALKGEEKNLKEAGLYDEHLHQIFKQHTPVTMMNYLRFYELSFVKKYFLKTLLDDMSKESFKSVKDYDATIKELNYIKLNFDEEVLFYTEGSPKDLYASILEKSATNKLEEKIEGLVKNIKEDVTNTKNSMIKKNETLILIITSLLTILLGYNGIKLIVNDILVKIPYIESYVAVHPLRTVGSIWILLVIIMASLNIKRWILNR